MILFRAGLSFRIDAEPARHPTMRAQFELEQSSGSRPSGETTEPFSLAFRRWWAERQPEARWARLCATGPFVVDVSLPYWREGAFLLTFDDRGDAQRFAMTFLGCDQAQCEAAMAGSGDAGSGGMVSEVRASVRG
jgi:hypothetical protein